MKTLAAIVSVVSVIVLVIQIRMVIMSNYTYEKKYEQLWQLADKSSTIPAKQQYISQFVDALKQGKTNGEFAENNAMFLKTPNNSFDSNIKAVETLSLRLTEIQNMNPSSFEYNTAIQQITAQEQGEAREMLRVFQGCYDLNCYSIVWNWIGALVGVSSILLLIFSGTYLFITWDDNRYNH